MPPPLIDLTAGGSTATDWPDTLRGKTVVVVGLGRLSGPAAVRVLCDLGATAIVNDAQPLSALQPILNDLQTHPGCDQRRVVAREHPVSLANEADLFVLSPGVPYDLPMLQAARDNGIETIGELEFAYRLTQTPFIAITGTKGKSSTATMLSRILSAGLDTNVCLAGNIGVPLCEEVRHLNPSDIIVAEVSSFQLESIVDFRPRIGVILNITPDHLDRHVTMEAYISAKRRLVENQQPSDLLVLNADDPLAEAFSTATKARVIRISMERVQEHGAYLQGEAFVWRDISTGAASDRIVAHTDDLSVPGKHNKSNALAAIAVAMGVGVDESAVRDGLRSFNGLEHALERVAERDGIRYVDDSKSTNVASVRAAVAAYASRQRTLVLIMGGVDKGNAYAELAPELLASCKHLVLLGPNVGRLHQEFSGKLPVSLAATMDEATSQARNAAAPGDVVLLSPGHASFDLFSDWKQRGDAFKQAVRNMA